MFSALCNTAQTAGECPQRVPRHRAALVRGGKRRLSDHRAEPHLAEDDQEAEGLTGGSLAPTVGCCAKHAPCRLPLKMACPPATPFSQACPSIFMTQG